MMSVRAKYSWRAVLITITLLTGSRMWFSADLRAADTPATAPAARSASEVMSDLRAASADVDKHLPPLNELLDAKVRKEAAPAAIPPLQKIIALLNELELKGPKPGLNEQRLQILTILTLLGDTPSRQYLEKSAQDKNPASALEAQLTIHQAEWWIASQDSAAQTKILASMTSLAKANPKSDSVAGTLQMMSRLGAAKPELARQARQIILTQLKGAVASQVQSQPQLDAPLALSGPTITGGKLNTADWKGKVILVDFWATWCGPCREEMPRVAGLYAKYRAQGLEIVGVSGDQNADDLKNYLAEHKEIAWPQIYEDNSPLLKRFGIEAIPTMYLIDRQGRLRTTTARGELETLIPKLLAEKAEAPTTKPAP